MTPSLTVLFCLGLSLGPRTCVQAGPLPKPTVWAEPGSVISWGSPVTIWCQGTPDAQEYHLDKEGSPAPWDTQNPLEPRNKAKFSIPSMTQHYAGRYRCYYHSHPDWSEDSDPLDLVMTGAYSKPILSVLPSPLVTSGESVTLLCQSQSPMDTFLLFKEGAAHPLPHLRSQHGAQLHWAEFPMGPVTSVHGGTYRCISSRSFSHYLLSRPSDPVELTVLGSLESPSPSPTRSISAAGPEDQSLMPTGSDPQSAQRQADFQRPPGAAEPEPKDGGLQRRSRPAADVQGENPNAAMKDTQPKDGVELDSRAATSEAPQDVTYAQLQSLTLRREATEPPPPQKQEPSAEPSVYATLAIH
uniref:Leukocyte immunoglobulin like receptor B4 n=1 Tax=Macaca mulatta TaxID=9544 RepID=A0A5F8A7Q3_MACMU